MAFRICTSLEKKNACLASKFYPKCHFLEFVCMCFIVYFILLLFLLWLHERKHHQINIARRARLVAIYACCLNNKLKRLHAVRPDFGSTQQGSKAENKAECAPHVLSRVVAFCGKALLGSFSLCGDECLRKRESDGRTVLAMFSESVSQSLHAAAH